MRWLLDYICFYYGPSCVEFTFFCPGICISQKKYVTLHTIWEITLKILFWTYNLKAHII